MDDIEALEATLNQKRHELGALNIQRIKYIDELRYAIEDSLSEIYAKSIAFDANAESIIKALKLAKEKMAHIIFKMREAEYEMLNIDNELLIKLFEREKENEKS